MSPTGAEHGLAKTLFPQIQIARLFRLSIDLRWTLLDRSTLKRTTFTDCDITELNASRAMLEDVEFVRCDMDNAIFDHAYLGRCMFNPNRAYGLKLRSALLIRCRFSQDQGAPELTRTQFSSATIVADRAAGAQPLGRRRAGVAAGQVQPPSRALARRAGQRGTSGGLRDRGGRPARRLVPVLDRRSDAF
jgi:uncharacterized protein YjbI with pentapeptide repeats